MHSDTKIGLAMAILLIGFAAALSFPRQPAVPPVPEIAKADQLDEAIKLLPIRAYTADEQSLKRQSPGEPSAVEIEAPPEPAFSPTDLVFASRSKRPEFLLAPPAPIPWNNDSGQHASQTAGESSKSSTVPTEAPQDGSNATPRENEAAVFHVVEAGDTLSGIAHRYLGSVARYHEIFEANRELLETPDQLRVGMKLRIPDCRRESATSPDSGPRR